MKKSMKKTLIIFLILILIIFLSIFSLIKIKKITSNSILELQKIEQNLNKQSKEELFKKTFNLEKNWQKNSNLLRICLKREPLEKLDVELLKLKTHIKNFNKPKIKKNLQIIIHHFKQLEKDSNPYLSNIL